jgi:hypothetical protein
VFSSFFCFEHSLAGLWSESNNIRIRQNIGI